MKLNSKIVNISRWDSYSFLIFLLAILIQAFKWGVLPIFIDIYYHLLTAVGFNEAGGWVSSCFWEYAPVGRPQVYPPLLHIILLYLIKLNIPLLIIGKLAQFVIYPLLLFTIWYVIRELFDKKQAFFTLLMFFSLYSFYLTAINTLPASLSLIFCLFSLILFEKNKILTSGIIFALSFYTHTFTSLIFLAVYIFYGILNNKRFLPSLKTILIALILSSPFIVFQLAHIRYFISQSQIVENRYLEINLLNWLILPFSLVVAFKKKGRHYIFISLFLSSLIFLFRGAYFRYLTFYGIIGAIFMNSVLVREAYELMKRSFRKIYLTAIFVLFFIFSPTLTIILPWPQMLSLNDEFFFKDTDNFKNTNLAFNYLDSNFINSILYNEFQNTRRNELTIYFPNLFNETVKIINENTNGEDIIYVNHPYTAGILGLLSKRATSTAMLFEVRPYKEFDKISASKLIIWQKEPEDLKKEPVDLVGRHNLKKIADTKLAFIYENPSCVSKKQRLSAQIGYKTLLIVIFLAAAFMMTSLKNSHIHP